MSQALIMLSSIPQLPARQPLGEVTRNGSPKKGTLGDMAVSGLRKKLIVGKATGNVASKKRKLGEATEDAAPQKGKPQTGNGKGNDLPNEKRRQKLGKSQNTEPLVPVPPPDLPESSFGRKHIAARKNLR